MYLADCPNCRKAILIPGNHMKAVARCPLCEYEFSVDGIPSREVPVVEVLRSDFSTIDGLDLTVQEAKLNFGLETSPPEQQRKPAEGAIDNELDLVLKSDAPHRAFELSADERATGVSVARKATSPLRKANTVPAADDEQTARTVATRRVHPKRRRSPMAEVIKVAAGGIAGLAIAQLILWWLPGAWRRDPLGMAPQLPALVAFLAPSELRASDGTTPPRMGEAPNAPDSVSRDEANDLNLGDVGLNTLVGEDDRGENDTYDTNEQPESPINSREQPDSSLSKANGIEIDEHDSVDFKSAERETDSSYADQPGDSSTLGPVNSPIITVAELNATMDTAKALANALVSEQDQRLTRTAQREFYVRLSELAWSATHLDRNGAGANQCLSAAETLLTGIGRDRFMFDVTGVGASGWLNYAGRTTSGIAIAGFARNVQPVDRLFVTRIELAGRPDRFVNVLSATDPRLDSRMPVHTDAPLIVLGIIVDDPATQIEGYDGNASTAIWQGLYATVEPPAAD